MNSYNLIIFLILLCNICFSQNDEYKDPYLWLEEINGKKAIEWVKKQNSVSAERIEKSHLYLSLRERLLKIYNDTDKIAYPEIVGDYVYNLWKDKKKQRGVWRRIPISDFIENKTNWEIILDIDSLSKNENKNWSFKGAEWLRPNSNNCLIFLSDGGSDKNYMREFNVISKEFVTNGFKHSESKDGANWINENTILVYRDFGPGTTTNAGFSRTIRRWERGTNIEDAETIFEIDSTRMKASSYVSKNDSKIQTILIDDNIENLEYYFLTKDRKIKLSLPDNALLQGIFKDEALLYLNSDWEVDKKRYKSGSLVSVNLHDNIIGKQNIKRIYSPDSESSFVDVALSKDFITVNIMENVVNKLICYDLNNDKWNGKNVNAPKLGSIRLLTSDPQSNDIFFLYSNLITQNTLYYFNKFELLAIKKMKNVFETDSLEIHQYYTNSKDGTRIPYFIVHKNNIKYDKNNPTIIYAYGGFNRSLQPDYNSKAGIGWLDQGGIYVLANIRGGGEYGPSWHKSAIKEKRQNAFDDLYAVTEDLISRNITSPQKLGFIGASNGGLLAGVAFTQKPELYNAIVCGIPLLDMKRFSKLLVGASWIYEYGNPEIPEEWEYLKKYSPYHNIEKNKKYPEIFLITTTRDDRVHPSHARKMAMKLSSMGHPYLFYENIEGGHGLGTTNEQLADSWARVYTFFNIKLNNSKSAKEILQNTINTIDTIETIYYKQNMTRTNPRNTNDTISRYREMYFKKLNNDSIVGVKGHWYMYINDKEHVVYEDIYDGKRLIRKNNNDSIARVYDLVKYPGFKSKHFWSHNTLFGMQYEFKYILNNLDSYSIEQLNDTIIENKNCYQVLVTLKDKTTMPGFAIKLEDNLGIISENRYFIDRQTNYPIRMRGESYTLENSEQKVFIDQFYYDIKFNIIINEPEQFNVTDKSIEGYEKTEMKPE